MTEEDFSVKERSVSVPAKKAASVAHPFPFAPQGIEGFNDYGERMKKVPPSPGKLPHGIETLADFPLVLVFEYKDLGGITYKKVFKLEFLGANTGPKIGDVKWKINETTYEDIFNILGKKTLLKKNLLSHVPEQKYQF